MDRKAIRDVATQRFVNQEDEAMTDHERLKAIIDNQQEERQRYKHAQGLSEDNENRIKEGLQMRVTDFYCKNCKCDYQDYRTTGVVETDWNIPGADVAYWNSKHRKCGRWNRRYITGKNNDPYWTRSPKMRRDRGNFYRDMIQPHESGFNLLYGRKLNT